MTVRKIANRQRDQGFKSVYKYIYIKYSSSIVVSTHKDCFVHGRILVVSWIMTWGVLEAKSVM